CDRKITVSIFLQGHRFVIKISYTSLKTLIKRCLIMIAIFDLDETLIHGDCVTLWCQWLCEQGLVQDIDAFLQEEIRLMDAYKAKTLDQQDCMNHVFAPIVHLQINEVQALVAQFVRAK